MSRNTRECCRDGLTMQNEKERLSGREKVVPGLGVKSISWRNANDKIGHARCWIKTPRD